MIAARGYPKVKVICFDEISLHKRHGKYVLVISAPELGLMAELKVCYEFKEAFRDLFNQQLDINWNKWFLFFEQGDVQRMYISETLIPSICE